ncbi:MAG TPA: FecR domain-containing protein [Steroidobacteraceae bacterium]|nr:FecR domain-containing protein [Steroidobacteraceae bacterium]
MTPAKDQVRIAAAGQAAEWFIANQDQAPDHNQRAAFVAWLKSSPIHIEEYLGIALVSRDLPAAVDDLGESLESLLERARTDAAERVVPMHTPRVPGSLRWNPAPQRRWALGAVAVVAAASVAWWLSADHSGAATQSFGTGHGEQAVQRLADGSVMHLNTDTALDVRLGTNRRDIRMKTGEAFFTVAHGDAREFRVRAGEAEILALGTQFDVRLKPRTILVTVVEGQVEVRASSRPGTRAPGTMRVAAGYQLQIDDGILAAQSERVDTAAAVAWRQRKIDFDSRPLGEVADEFNRYGVVQFVIEDAGLRALRVSGVFDAYDSESFAAFLESLDGVRIERTASEIRVVRQEAREPGEPPPN